MEENNTEILELSSDEIFVEKEAIKSSTHLQMTLHEIYENYDLRQQYNQLHQEAPLAIN